MSNKDNKEGTNERVEARFSNIDRPDFPKQFDVSVEGLINVPDKALTLARERKDARGLDLLTSETSPEQDIEWLRNAPYEAAIHSSYPGNLYISSSQIPNPDAPHARLQVARIEFDTNSGQVKTVHRTVTPGIFRAVIADFPRTTLLGQIREVLKLSNPTENDRAEYARLVEEARRVELTRDEILKLSRSNIAEGALTENRENTHQIHNIFQGEYSVVSNGSIRYLATFGALDCLIFSIYNPRHQKGALAHIDDLTDEVLTAQIMAREVGINRQNDTDKGIAQEYKITILGGTLASAHNQVNLYQEIKKWQEKEPNIQILIGPVSTGASQSLVLDLSSGEIKRLIPNSSFHPEWSLTSLSVMSRAMEAKTRGRQVARLSLPKSL